MPIQFDVPPGTVLLCDYSSGFREPEMVKRRPALVISPRLRQRTGLCTVVPLSTTPPDAPQAYHIELEMPFPLPAPWASEHAWAKGDMLATVSFERLDLFRTDRDQYGKRKYLKPRISAEQLSQVRECVKHALGLLT